jgi:hypothetical protein
LLFGCLFYHQPCSFVDSGGHSKQLGILNT